MTHTLQFRRRHLPHWEVEHGRYFVTVRCADSLPREAAQRLAEIHESLSATVPRSSQFAAQQREVFLTLEKYLDAGHGACPLRRDDVARLLVGEFEALKEWDVTVPHFSVMPNHWHALLVPAGKTVRPLSQIMKRLKGRTGKRIREIVDGSGPVWQGEWFDRWVRDEREWDRIVDYIRNNPVKAGLVPNVGDHAWTR